MSKWIEIRNSFYNLNEILWVENNEEINKIEIVFKNKNEAILHFDNTVDRNETYEKIKKELLK